MEERFPAKFVQFRDKDKQRGRVPGSIPGPSRWNIDKRKQIIQHIESLMKQVEYILTEVFPKYDGKISDNREVPLPIVIKMEDRMLAKSHRPDTLISETEAKLLAVHALGKLIVGATIETLESLLDIMQEVIQQIPLTREDWLYIKPDKNGINRFHVRGDKTREYELIHELTSIKELSPYTSEDVLEAMGALEWEEAKKDGEIKVRFFNYNDDEIDTLIFSSFISNYQHFGLEPVSIKKYRYTDKLNTYIVPYVNDEFIELISNFPGLESVSSFVRFVSLTNATFEQSAIIDELTPQQGISYPKVAIVDSGISQNNKHLQPWVIEQHEYVPKNLQDNYHGEFVGGMLIYPHVVNQDIREVVDSGVLILDVVALPDSKKESIREDDLLNILEEMLETYGGDYKVWNLSLGSKRLCSGVVTEFTAAIDQLQDIYNIHFVIAAGNYSDLRDSWPIEDIFEDESDRICLPADSLRAITVGAVALHDDGTSLVSEGQPVPYSRRGPGIGLTIKPDVVHYSGNPTQFPINSINTKGEVVSDFGTSFSAPLVSALLAEYYEQFPGELSRTMAKALLIHGSSHPITKRKITEAKDLYFYGFGSPRRIRDILYGNDHEITMLFEGNLNYSLGTNWIKVTDFPFPDSLEVNDKIRGEIIVTLAFEPYLNPQYGSEYVRSNVDLRIRTLIDGRAETITKGSTAGEMLNSERWEKDQMIKELKWSTIKQLKFSRPKGVKGTKGLILELFPTWRDLRERHSIPFAIAITIRDPKGQAPVYNEVSRQLLQSFNSADINLRYTPTRISNR